MTTMMCDIRFCEHVATWTGPVDGADAFTCDEHVPRAHSNWRRMEGAAEMATEAEVVVDQQLLDRLDRSLTNQAPDREQVERIEAIREAAKELGKVIANYCGDSRERSLACTHLEETTMWAVKSIVLEP
jgi:hypothetical protein